MTNAALRISTSGGRHFAGQPLVVWFVFTLLMLWYGRGFMAGPVLQSGA